MLFEGGFSFTNFVADVFAVFMFVVWFWLLVTVASDLFRRGDVSGLGKAAWVILLLVLPYIGVFAFLLLARSWHVGAARTAGPARAQ